MTEQTKQTQAITAILEALSEHDTAEDRQHIMKCALSSMFVLDGLPEVELFRFLADVAEMIFARRGETAGDGRARMSKSAH